jgi:uncharacterized membrane protein YgcG
MSPLRVVLLLVVVAALMAPLAAPLSSQERIRSYDTEIEVRADGSIEVAEHITVRAEGTQIRRGIYRDVPTRYRDRYGNRVRVDLEVLGVERDGRPEAWFTERRSNGVRINTGGDDFLPRLPAEYTFTIRYRTTRQLGFFADHDELYWNAIGHDWVFPIEAGITTVRLPEPVAVDLLGAEAYTGPQGARGTAYSTALPLPGLAEYRLTSGLGPREGFTIVLTFPKGLIAEPTGADRARWFLSDNAGILVALLGLLAMLLYCAVVWWRVGRDPRPGVVIPRYEPPADHTPASLRYLRRMDYDMRCFSADLLALAVGGHVRIHEDRVRRSSVWRLERTEPTPVAATSMAGDMDARATAATRSGATARPHARLRPLLETLLPSRRSRLDLKDSNAEIVAAARDAHKKALDQALHPEYFLRNTRKAWTAFAVLIVTGFAAFLASGGSGIPVIVLILFVMLVVSSYFTWLVRAPTDRGRRLLDEIDGLKLYLSVAERDELAGLQAPTAPTPGPPGEAPEGLPGAPPRLDAERYEALLPYAVALQVEDAWTKKFTAAAGAAAVAAATGGMAWYAGSGRPTDLGGFTRSIGSSLTSSIASASSPPGSSSGSGGGGSSGGGGGGGGGGGR